jgi:hypothetical protein
MVRQGKRSRWEEIAQAMAMKTTMPSALMSCGATGREAKGCRPTESSAEANEYGLPDRRPAPGSEHAEPDGGAVVS